VIAGPENARLRRPLPIEEARTYKSVVAQIHGVPRYRPIRDLTHGGDVDALMFFYDLDANQRALQSREGAVPIDISPPVAMRSWERFKLPGRV
jgi:hypothetical protein